MRPIETEGYKPVPEGGDAGPAPMLQWVPIAQLVVDDEYQRPIAPQGRRNVQRIAERFEWSKFAPVVVAPAEGGLFAVIDGQHRTTAAKLRGHAQVPCMIVPVGRKLQAEAFGAINGVVTKLTAVQLHRAAVAAGDEQALRIERVCRAAGVKITHSSTLSVLRVNAGPRSTTADRTASVGAIRNQLAIMPDATVVLGLKAIVAGTPDHSLLNGSVMSAVCSILNMHDEWCVPEARLLAAFQAMDLEDLLTKARIKALRSPGVDASSMLQADLTDRLTRKFGRVA